MFLSKSEKKQGRYVEWYARLEGTTVTKPDINGTEEEKLAYAINAFLTILNQKINEQNNKNDLGCIIANKDAVDCACNELITAVMKINEHVEKHPDQHFDIVNINELVKMLASTIMVSKTGRSGEAYVTIAQNLINMKLKKAPGQSLRVNIEHDSFVAKPTEKHFIREAHSKPSKSATPF